jgi:hypothetical protein
VHPLQPTPLREGQTWRTASTPRRRSGAAAANWFTNRGRALRVEGAFSHSVRGRSSTHWRRPLPRTAAATARRFFRGARLKRLLPTSMSSNARGGHFSGADPTDDIKPTGHFRSDILARLGFRVGVVTEGTWCPMSELSFALWHRPAQSRRCRGAR